MRGETRAQVTQRKLIEIDGGLCLDYNAFFICVTADRHSLALHDANDDFVFGANFAQATSVRDVAKEIHDKCVSLAFSLLV
eukprot:CAMPEP_0202690048 /NCGR_PEP_ID=MMETSP1385-20130828/5177_1 /ASSEMBLY_ACC=CAM_ASM_000861 /TAXON_ID=933848 /ORGANISM="Elphidium margaritaceum" /LENGTH=80 /DNA_ID=CAMNT_0049345275 /DNA_START=433 /DNA_END=675 /DNA_ORIENTATION=-